MSFTSVRRSTGQIVRDDADKIRHSYNNVTYFMMGQLNINRENSLRLLRHRPIPTTPVDH